MRVHDGVSSRERLEDVISVARQRGLNATEYIKGAVFDAIAADLNMSREDLEIVNLSGSDKFLLTKLVAEQEGVGPWEYILEAINKAKWRDLYSNSIGVSIGANFTVQRAETGIRSWC